MKTLVVVLMVIGFSAHAKNASCKAMEQVKLEVSTNPSKPVVAKASPSSGTAATTDGKTIR